jgi:DNA-directed RNA polymerase subunit RPC12/RpoP
MVKKYRLGKSSDMRRFQRDLQKSIQNQTYNAISNLNINCPKCKRKIRVSPGIQNCPYCTSKIDFKVNF